MVTKILAALSVVLLMLAVACSSEDASTTAVQVVDPTSTPYATYTPEPTSTAIPIPEPTPTVAPTSTPEPTATATIVPTPTSTPTSTGTPTPTATPIRYTHVGGPLTADTIWTQDKSPYLVSPSWVQIPIGVTLTINPGVEVIFDHPGRNSGIAVAGNLIAKGTSSQKIVFKRIGEPGGTGHGGHMFGFSGSDYSAKFDHIKVDGRSWAFSNGSKFSLTNSHLSNFDRLEFSLGIVSGNTFINVLTMDVDNIHGHLEGFSNNCIKYLGERTSSGAISNINFNSREDGANITGNSFYIADKTIGSLVMSRYRALEANLSDNYWGGLTDEEVRAIIKANSLTFVVDNPYLPTLATPHPETPRCND